jgi:flagella basal body P-ring formation protein FlgA
MRPLFLRLLSVLLLLSGAATMLRAQSVVPTTTSGTPPRGVARISVGVATRALARGDTLTATDIAVVDTTIVWRWNTVAPDTLRAAPGWVTHRAIAAGEVLRAPAVLPPAAIASGAAVTAIYRDGALRLVLTGIATNSAAIGAPVGIRIDRSRRLDGIAVGPNLVRLR